MVQCLDNSAKIGNFVEIKKSKIGQNSKANHHAYLGDATIGKKSNIGAGTITCNYDGENKHKTKIGDSSLYWLQFIISCSPKIRQESYVAAGSVVTTNVPSKSLAFGRAKQKNKKLEEEIMCGIVGGTLTKYLTYFG